MPYEYRLYRARPSQHLPEEVLFPERPNSDVRASGFENALREWERQGAFDDAQDGEKVVVLNMSDSGGCAIFTIGIPEPKLTFTRYAKPAS